MNKKIYILIYLLLLLPSISNLIADKFIEIDDIIIDDKKTVADSTDFVITDSSSIKVLYHCNANGEGHTPFLFRIVLENEMDSAVTVWNEPQVKFENLPESNYKLNISAFDLQRNWFTKIKSFTFKVDNEELELKHENRLLKRRLFVSDSLLNIPTNQKSEGIDIKSLLFGIFSVILLVLVIYIFYRFIFKGKKSTMSIQEIQDKLDGIKQENQKLKHELATLRGQINNLQIRGDKLMKQNRELESHIEKLKSKKDELESLQTQKDELFAMLIHDIKNPAGIIKSLVQLLKDYDLTAVDQQDIMNDIIATTAKIVSLSQEVSRVLALEGGNLRLEYDRIALSEVGNDVFRRFKIKAQEKNIKMISEFEDNMPEAEADPNKIDEVLSNLISNAIKFTKDGGAVKLKLYKKNEDIILEVKDNGPGLSEDDLNHAFQRGAQLSAKPTAGENSTGLGLWIVKKLVEAHKGSVWVRSSLGKGATFAFSIPINKK